MKILLRLLLACFGVFFIITGTLMLPIACIYWVVSGRDFYEDLTSFYDRILPQALKDL